MAAGRPLKFKSVEELQAKIDAYFAACDSHTSSYVLKTGEMIQIPDPKPYTITGLAIALDTTRETLLDYGEREEFSDAIRKAKLKCQNCAEESLWKPKIATGVIFNLVNNYGWKNKTETDVTSGGEKLQPAVINIIKPDGIELSPQPEAIPGVAASDGSDND